jgi:hypothetical protein
MRSTMRPGSGFGPLLKKVIACAISSADRRRQATGLADGQPLRHVLNRVSTEDREKVRTYVIHRAHETRKPQAAAVAAPPARDVPVAAPR